MEKSFSLDINRRNLKNQKILKQTMVIVTINFNIYIYTQCILAIHDFFSGTFNCIEQCDSHQVQTFADDNQEKSLIETDILSLLANKYVQMLVTPVYTCCPPFLLYISDIFFLYVFLRYLFILYHPMMS